MNGGIATSPKAKEANSRGQVLKFEGASKQSREYHPDGNSQYLRLHLAALTPSDIAPPPMKSAVGFWKDGHPPRDAMPVLLELRRARANPRKPRVEIDFDATTIDGVHVHRILISMQPATKIGAAAVAEPAPAAVVRSHAVGAELKRHALKLTGAGGSPDDATAALLVKMLADAVVSTLNGAQTITLVHAQQRPGAPSFVGPKDKGAITRCR